jgi:hypothetical protein
MVNRGDWTVELRTDPDTFSAYKDDAIAAIRDAVVAHVREQLVEVALGYVLCVDCNEATPIEVSDVTGGLCGPCMRNRVRPATKELDVVIEGRLSKVPVGRPKRKRYGSRGSPETRRKAEQAKRAALRRLRILHPETYDALLAGEREKRGLDPYPLQRMVHVGTVDRADAYAPSDGATDG